MIREIQRVLVVILNWNGADDTVACLEGLLALEGPPPSIVVVDNASSDDSLDVLRPFGERGDITIIENATNDGFAGGVNVGIRHGLEAGYDAIALLNNDAVPDAAWLRRLVQAMERTGASIVTGLIVDETGTLVDSSGDFYSWWGMPFPRSRNLTIGAAPRSGFVAAASGGATLYRNEVFNDIGLFDDAFFAYFEDVDFSLRAQLRRHRVYYERDAVVRHKRGASSSRVEGFTTFQSFKNLPQILIKDVPGAMLPVMLPLFLLLYGAMFGNAVRTGRGRYAWRGIREAWRLAVSRSMRERRRIQSSRLLGVREFTHLLAAHNPLRRERPDAIRP